MTTAKFRRCDAVTARWEGGDVHHPKDPGGRTSRGVTQRTYDDSRRRKGLPRRDVFQMTEDERFEIYQFGYWRPVRGDQLPDGVDLVAYDAGVNSGPGRSARWLQQAVNDTAGRHLVAVDGGIGPNTVGGARSVSALKLIEAACARRRSFLQGLKIFSTFGRGWMRRVADVEARATSWAVAAIGGDPSAYLRNRAAIADNDAKAADRKATSSAVGGAGAGGGAAAGDFPIEAIGALIVLGVIAAFAFHLKSKQNRAREEAFAAVAKESSNV